MKYKPTYYVNSEKMETKDWSKNNWYDVASFVDKWNDQRMKIIDKLTNTSYFGNNKNKEEHFYIDVTTMKNEMDELISLAYEYNINKRKYVVKD